MKKSTKRWLGTVALTAAGLGAIGAFVMNKSGRSKRAQPPDRDPLRDVWARPGMKVTFRAELMPGRDGEERTYRVTSLLPSGRVLLDRVAGEHAQKEFERVR